MQHMKFLFDDVIFMHEKNILKIAHMDFSNFY